MVVVVIIVLAGIYFATTSLKGNQSTTIQGIGRTSTFGSGGGDQTSGLLQLFGYFSQMQVQETSNTLALQDGRYDQQTVSYLVLGTGQWNSAAHLRVEFSTAGVGNNVVAWFNSSGGVDRLDILGQRNYSGPLATIEAQNYVSAFSQIQTITNNATLLSILSMTTENMTSIWPTTMDVVTYHLAAPRAPYKSITAQYATVPGTNEKIAVFLYEKATDGTEITMRVLSITR